MLKLADGSLCVVFDTVDPAPCGDGYTRGYALESTTDLTFPAWRGIDGYTNVPGDGAAVVYTNGTGVRTYRGRVWLQPQVSVQWGLRSCGVRCAARSGSVDL